MLNRVPGTGGNVYIPYEDRSGEKSIVYFTSDLSPEGLLRIYDRVSSNLQGKIAVKLHTGEPEGPNIIPRPWAEALMEQRLKDSGTIVETNTYYEAGGTQQKSTERRLRQMDGHSARSTFWMKTGSRLCLSIMESGLRKCTSARIC